ncbi:MULTISPECIES: porin [Comamonas]|jgi:predicted porin|uniref:porin n=1 Tax=Comamonas TaxID=283 RepID=UPI0012CC7032|nr:MULTISPECIES: porin [Comamonas]MDR3067395.1 porin [Comamonas sp.]MEB5965895.1 porin [Comamonas testosteroni]MPS88054.1 porin [Comamonas sp.]
MTSSFVKKTLALAVLGSLGTMAYAQSSVQLYGIVDAAIRHTTNEGANKSGLTKMIGGGMSESRWGINIKEDLGGGLSAIANLENRFWTDSGTPSTAQPYFAQSWVGLRSTSFGQLTMGRQYNVLFDLVTSTYASFPYSPYMDAYKPEIGMSLGARANNMLKYVAEFGPVRAGLQYSFDEGNTFAKKGGSIDMTPGGLALKTAGAYLRYSADGISVGGAFQRSTLPAGTDVDAWTLGGSYRTGPLYLMAGYGQNKVKDSLGAAGAGAVFDAGLLNAYWTGSSNGGFIAGNAPGNFANKREMFKVGFGYQVTPQLNAGMHYYHAKQSGSATGAFNGKADFIVAVADYAFSKRTDAYFAVDHTKTKGGAGVMLDANGAKKRTGITIGLRHRF